MHPTGTGMLNRKVDHYKPVDADEESAITPSETDKLMDEKNTEEQPPSKVIPAFNVSMKAAEFLFSFFGLMISYVTWGIMQELIMNTKFSPTPLVPSGMFPSSKRLTTGASLQLESLSIFSCIAYRFNLTSDI